MARQSEISAAALAVLAAATVTEDRVTLPAGQLPRPLYVEVNDVLARLGGKWKGGKVAAHLFDHDPREEVAVAVATGKMPPRNPLDYFATPPELAEEIVARYVPSDVPAAPRVLEPSAGEGSLARAVVDARPAATVECVELDPRRAAKVRAEFPVHEGDFLSYEAAEPYDLVVMNPPFTAPGDALAYVAHIERAYRMLRHNGVLVAVVPLGFVQRQDRRVSEFRARVDAVGGWDRLPDGAFESSGTGVATAVLWMRRAGAGTGETKEADRE